MVDIHFIQDPIVLGVLNGIVELAGPNYAIPYDAYCQPVLGTELNEDDLLQCILPGGAKISGMSEPGMANSIGTAINSVMAALYPFVSAYMLILPILGIIKGIIEIICALMNPWAVIRAVIRLFKKWIPPFLALFPPFAGLLIIISILKIILSIVLFILTVVIPTYELIKANVELLSKAFDKNSNKQQRNAAKEKLLAIIIQLLNQIGLMNVLRPILDMVLTIMKLYTGKPCKKGSGDDSTCCDEFSCPTILKNPPKGRAMLVPAQYGDAPPQFAWKLITLSGNSRISDLAPYMQSMKAQLDQQLDEPVDESRSAGQSGDSSHFNVRISNKRGSEFVLSPIVKLEKKNVYIIDPTLSDFVGAVNYEIVTNWEILIARNIVGLGCHPDIESAKDEVGNRFADIEKPIEEKYPEVSAIFNRHSAVVSDLNNLIDQTKQIIDDIVDKEPPYDLAPIDTIENNMVELLKNYIDELKSTLRSILSKMADTTSTEFDVDKNIVKSDNKDLAVIHVIPKDISGSAIASNLPSDVEINVDLFTTFGAITNKTIDNNTGTITAEIKSLIPGVAKITAKVNSEYIKENINGNIITKEISVRFIADGILPQRRLISKQNSSNSAKSTVNLSEKSPGVGGRNV